MKWMLGMGIILFMSCQVKSSKEGKLVNVEAEKIDLMEADRAFSDMSEKEGMKAAYLEYTDSNVVLLRPNIMPVTGADAIDFLITIDDTGYTFNWEPQRAHVSALGDMGFTYGVYGLHPKDVDTTYYGTYVNIWKKQADGKWKLALDSGNEGVEAVK